ncbi:unnamed protein product [Thlaspi arvense]|uniref:Uncharacterized protein n=1 Tax=Thlaspi arvense TaxID=13288 RepID=A0AAU9S069_THLAR|nr:unnamed protein product [Thlaspi arvense]
MTPNHLRSVTAQVTRGGSSVVSRRSLSTGSRRKLSSSPIVYVRKVERFIARSVHVKGDTVSELEEMRKKDIKDALGWIPRELEEDLREKMWPELREMKRMWSDAKETMFPVRKS